jgi:hypothetical protein
MKKLFFSLCTVALFTVLPGASASAKGTFEASMVCNFGNGWVSGGSVMIDPAGQLHLNMSGLPPNLTALCSLVCNIDEGQTLNNPCGTTGTQGKLGVNIQGFVQKTLVEEAGTCVDMSFTLDLFMGTSFVGTCAPGIAPNVPFSEEERDAPEW